MWSCSNSFRNPVLIRIKKGNTCLPCNAGTSYLHEMRGCLSQNFGSRRTCASLALLDAITSLIQLILFLTAKLARLMTSLSWRFYDSDLDLSYVIIFLMPLQLPAVLLHPWDPISRLIPPMHCYSNAILFEFEVRIISHRCQPQSDVNVSKKIGILKPAAWGRDREWCDSTTARDSFNG